MGFFLLKKCIYILVIIQFAILFLVLVYNKDAGEIPEKGVVLSAPSGPSSAWVDPSSPEISNGLGVIPERGLIDRWRLYKTHLFAATGSNWESLSGTRKVCLATQASIDVVYWLASTVENWSGPISIAIFTPDIEYDISVHYINYLRACYPKIKEQVSFHFVYPLNHTMAKSEALSLHLTNHEATCEEDPKEFIQYLLQIQDASYTSWRGPLEYPQNLLRNIAKSSCQTLFTFIPDVDMIPSLGLNSELEKFLSEEAQDKCDKCAYVVPVYEINSNVSSLPENKTELVELVELKLARQFHQEVWKLNQQSSNLSRWEEIPEEVGLKVAYQIEKYLWMYEPVYVSKGDTPIFDERFIGFGMTRNTQAYEMYVAGYSFLVLNNGFASHWGFQHVKDRPKWRSVQQATNEAKFEAFAKEITARYGHDPYKMLDLIEKKKKKKKKSKAKAKAKKKSEPTS